MIYKTMLQMCHEAILKEIFSSDFFLFLTQRLVSLQFLSFRSQSLYSNIFSSFPELLVLTFLSCYPSINPSNEVVNQLEYHNK